MKTILQVIIITLLLLIIGCKDCPKSYVYLVEPDAFKKIDQCYRNQGEIMIKLKGGMGYVKCVDRAYYMREEILINNLN